MAIEEPLWENRTLLQIGRLYCAQKLFMFAIACYESVIEGLLPYVKEAQTVETLLFETLYHVGQLSGEVDCQGWEAEAYQQVSHHYTAANRLPQLAHLFERLGHRHETHGNPEIALDCYAQVIAICPQRTPTRLPQPARKNTARAVA